MAADELQQLVDRLAKELGRGVIIEDRGQRLIAYSAHLGEADDLRMAAIMHRRSPKPVRDWLRTLKIDDLTSWARIPANPALGMEQRICVPIRFNDETLAMIWVIEGDAMTAYELDVLSREAGNAAAVLYRNSLLLQLEGGLEREKLRDLVSDSVSLRQEASAHLIEADLLRVGRSVCVFVCSLGAEGAIFSEQLRIQMEGALHAVRASIDRREFLFLVRPDHALCVLSVRENRAADFVSTVLERLVEGMRGLGAESDERLVVTAGGAYTDLTDAALSYIEALSTARIVQAFPSLGDAVHWDQLGAYRLLGHLAEDDLAPELLHPGVLRLLTSKSADERLKLLEVYLDANGDATVTADVMGVHRTSVYYRLARIEEAMGVSLQNGVDRLGIHLSVKLLRLRKANTQQHS